MAFMDIFDLYNATVAGVNTQQGGCLKPYGNFNQWLNEISTDLFNEKFGDAEKSQTNNDQLDNPFLKSLNVITNPNTGRNFDTITLPADYGYFSAVRVFQAINTPERGCLCKDYDMLFSKDDCRTFDDPEVAAVKEKLGGEYVNEVTAGKLDNARWGAAAEHKLFPPSVARPIVTQVDGGIKIAPRGVGIVVLDYYRLPRKAVFAYTTVGDQIQYNLGASTQLDWPDLVRPEFLARLKIKYASFTRNPQQYQEGQLERKQTI